jgi:hypothetical protein
VYAAHPQAAGLSRSAMVNAAHGDVSTYFPKRIEATMRVELGMLFRLFAAALTTVLAAGSASAGYVYRLVGGQCLDSSRDYVFYPELGSSCVGPKACSQHVFGELRLTDAYVPGTGFLQAYGDTADPIVESFEFLDGAYSIVLPGSFRSMSFGAVLPERFGPAEIRITGEGGADFGYIFRPDGTWQIGERGFPGFPCQIGSTEGLTIDVTGVCQFQPGVYLSTGTYVGWLACVPASGVSSSQRGKARRA